jgi:hypothetical protein
MSVVVGSIPSFTWRNTCGRCRTVDQQTPKIHWPFCGRDAALAAPSTGFSRPSRKTAVTRRCGSLSVFMKCRRKIRPALVMCSVRHRSRASPRHIAICRSQATATTSQTFRPGVRLRLRRCSPSTLSPTNLPQIKIELHKRAIAAWAGERGISHEAAWATREACIAALATKSCHERASS